MVVVRHRKARMIWNSHCSVLLPQIDAENSSDEAITTVLGRFFERNVNLLFWFARELNTTPKNPNHALVAKP